MHRANNAKTMLASVTVQQIIALVLATSLLGIIVAFVLHEIKAAADDDLDDDDE